jgi:hypothetical protein
MWMMKAALNDAPEFLQASQRADQFGLEIFFV